MKKRICILIICILLSIPLVLLPLAAVMVYESNFGSRYKASVLSD